MTPEHFIATWKDNPLTERAGAQAHFDDLCDLLGVDKPRDPDNYCFERGAKKAGGGDGWADVWKRGHFGWENKKPGRDLDAALKQLTDYTLQLENPPLLVVCDRERIVIHTAFTGYPDEPREIRIDDLTDPDTRQILRWVFTDPEKLRPEKSTAAITAQAAGQFAQLAAALRQRGEEGQKVAHFLVQCLFCMFAEDEALLPAGLFTGLLANAGADAGKAARRIERLFKAMRDKGGEYGDHDIPWFNGGLFKTVDVPALLPGDIQALHRAAADMDWRAIDPTIFGTLFERGLDPAARAPLGAHYTDTATIEKLIRPLISAPLAAEWAATRAEMAAKPKKARPLYQTFLLRLNRYRVLDPACGSGNFLYLALKALRDVEKQAHVDAIELGQPAELSMQTGPHNLLGIEINEFAAELARVTVWIGDIQWCRRNGYPHAVNPILKPLDGIEHRDALLRPSPASGRGVGGEGGEQINPRPPTPLPPEKLAFARELRRKQTDAETLVWHLIRNRQLKNTKFRRQHPVGKYILDFYCAEHGLAIELDGGQHDDTRAYDAGRDAWLASQGIHVLRFWNNQVLNETGAVLEAIWQALPECEKAPSPPTPLPLAGEGSDAEADWPAADVIVGNPPFLGDKVMRGELGDDYVDTLRRVYAGRVPGGADLVTYWFEKARAQIAAGKLRAAGLVATNSIRGGANRKVLERVLDTTRIFEAWSDEPWVNEGAAVRVSLVCFGALPAPGAANAGADAKKPRPSLPSPANRGGVGEEGMAGPAAGEGALTPTPLPPAGEGLSARLDGRPVAEIHADLTAGEGLNLSTAKRLPENASSAFMGVTKVGSFDIDGELARQWLTEPNPNCKPNSNVVRPSWNGLDLTRRLRDHWIIDFGVDISEDEASLYELPFGHLNQTVRQERQSNNREQYRIFWWRHGESRPAMRRALSGLSRFIATPEVAKHRIFCFVPAAVLPDKNLQVIARSDDTTFGILHSRFHELWSLRLGTSLEDRPRYTPTTTFETFPFPEGLTPRDTVPSPPAPLPQAGEGCAAARVRVDAEAIAAAARQLNELRENWLNPPEWVDWVITPEEEKAGFPRRPVAKPGHENDLKKRTLTLLYNARPAWLDLAHQALDRAVAAAYGWTDYTPAMPDEEILRRLLALNLQRAG